MRAASLILLVLLLIGCAHTKPVEVAVIADTIHICNTPPQADKIIMLDVDFKIIKDEFGIYWVGITPKHYENMAVNMKSILAHIDQKNSIIKYYESCIRRE